MEGSESCSSPPEDEDEVRFGGGERGQLRLQVRANFEVRESRMQIARATVLGGKEARERIAWTKGSDGVDKEVESGIRFVRRIAGPI